MNLDRTYQKTHKTKPVIKLRNGKKRAIELVKTSEVVTYLCIHFNECAQGTACIKSPFILSQIKDDCITKIFTWSNNPDFE